MSSSVPRERLQPALIDRLRSEKPKQSGRASQRVLSLSDFRASVMRDLEWLLNSENLGSTVDLEDYPEVAKSVLNYGVASFAGRTISSTDAVAIQQSLRNSILCFEPRIDPRSLDVRIASEQGESSRSRLKFTIVARVWAEPVPLELSLVSEFDLETGDVRVVENDQA